MTAIAWAEYFQKLPGRGQQRQGPDIGLMHETTWPPTRPDRLSSRSTMWRLR